MAVKLNEATNGRSAMSMLLFDRQSGRIGLVRRSKDGKANLVGIWPAHNATASKSQGQWPKGTYKYAGYSLHAEMGLGPACSASAYGCFGIYIFDVDGRPGMGVHAGRTHGEPGRLGGKTLGCIRVP